MLRPLLAFLALLSTLLAQSAPPIFVEVVSPTGPFWVQQTVPLQVRIGYDAEYLRDHSVPLFQQRLDLPFQVNLPWLLGDSQHAVTARESVDGLRIAGQERALRWHKLEAVTQGDRRYERIELHCDVTPLVAGSLLLPAVEVRYAFAERFENHLLRGRQPIDRKEATVRSVATELAVRDLPREGRPAGFTGAVGEFSIVARCAATKLALGETLQLEVEVTGAGNLQRFAAMPWPLLPGFVVQGMVERRSESARTFVFDVLAVREGELQLAPIAFPFFATDGGGYRTVATEALAVHVAAGAAALPARVQQLVAADAAAQRAASAWPAWYYAVAFAGLVVVGLVGTLASRRRRRGQTLRMAQKSLADALGGGPTAAAEAFVAYCAQCAQMPDARTPWELVLAALSKRPVPEQVLAEVQAVHAELDAARYGGKAPSAEHVLGAARMLAQLCG
jgi:hypothetical protein